jgi:hypothetical protein
MWPTRPDQPLTRFAEWHKGRIGDFGSESFPMVSRILDGLLAAIDERKKVVESSPRPIGSIPVRGLEGARDLRRPEEISGFVKRYIQSEYFADHWTSDNLLRTDQASRLASAELRAYVGTNVAWSSQFYWRKAMAEFAPRGA